MVKILVENSNLPPELTEEIQEWYDNVEQILEQPARER